VPLFNALDVEYNRPLNKNKTVVNQLYIYKNSFGIIPELSTFSALFKPNQSDINNPPKRVVFRELNKAG